MGFFKRNKDDQDDEHLEGSYGQPAEGQPAPPLPAPSVDGVLPPGVQPQPAPPSHNLASQTPLPADPGTAVPVSDNDAGDYIVTDPPAQQADDWSEPPAEPATEEHHIEPAYQETDAPQPQVEEPAPEPGAQPEPEFEPAAEPPAETYGSAEPEPAPELTEPTAEAEQTEEPAPEPETAAEPVPISISTTSPQELDDIKHQALTQLSTLAGHLEQTPEEKFHTTMMLVQATDDRSLIKTAYDAAQAITDEKARAQALLDVVNEINYFSQKNGS